MEGIIELACAVPKSTMNRDDITIDWDGISLFFLYINRFFRYSPDRLQKLTELKISKNKIFFFFINTFYYFNIGIFKPWLIHKILVSSNSNVTQSLKHVIIHAEIM